MKRAQRVIIWCHFWAYIIVEISESISGSLGVFPTLTLFKKCEIKILVSVHWFWILQTTLTGLLLVCSYTKLDTGGLDYAIYLVWWNQIIMYLSPSCIYIIYLSSNTRKTLDHRFMSQWLIIDQYYQYRYTIHVPMFCFS